MNSIIRLAYYLQKESYDSEFLFLEKLLKEASLKDAKYLAGINLGALRKEFPKKEEDTPRSYYEMLGEMAKKGPYFSKEAIDFIRDNIDEDLIPSNRKEFVKWLATELNKMRKRQYPNVNDIAMIKDWLIGTGWPEDEGILLSDLDLDYAMVESKEWHRAPSGPAAVGTEIKKETEYAFENGSKIVYEPTVTEDPTARKRLGQKLGLCLAQGLYSDDREGRIYSLRSPTGKAGACIRIRDSEVKEIKGPGNRPSSITILNAKMIKEWLDKRRFGFSKMGSEDFGKLPPTTWEEAKKLWESKPGNFFDKGWFRGYRREFEPELEKMMTGLFSTGYDNRVIQPWLLTSALRNGVHHLYSNIFARYLKDIAAKFPIAYLRYNLPRTYSSSIFDETHKNAVDNLVERKPSAVINYINPRARRSDFAENIMEMLRVREKEALENLVLESDVNHARDLGERLMNIERAYNNTATLKKYPEIVEEMTKNVSALLTLFSFGQIPEGIVKGIVKSRLYRRGGIFKEVVEETVDRIKISAGLEPEHDDELAEQWSAGEFPTPADREMDGYDVMPSFYFEMGLHNTKEYRHLVADMARNFLKLEKDRLAGGSVFSLYDLERYVLDLKAVPDDIRQEIAELKLQNSDAQDYLRYKKYYANPLFLETTIKAVTSLGVMQAYRERFRGEGLNRGLEAIRNIDGYKLFYTPSYIKRLQGIVPDELIQELKDAFSYVVKEKKFGLEQCYLCSAAVNFLNNANKIKEFPEVANSVFENSFRNMIDGEFSSGIDEEQESWRYSENLRTVQTSIDLIRKVKKFGLQNKITLLPEFLVKFGQYSQELTQNLYEAMTAPMANWMASDENLGEHREKISENINQHLKLIRRYVNFGLHKDWSNGNEELSLAINRASGLIFSNLKDSYRQNLSESSMSHWGMFGLGTNIEQILNTHYYNDRDYPPGLYEKDEEAMEDLKEEFVKLDKAKTKNEALLEFLYGFMYWSVSTFNSMGEEAARQESDIEEYMDQFKNLWPKRTGLGFDEYFKKGYDFRDNWERRDGHSDIAGPWRPIPYEQEDVEQQLTREYMQEYYEDLNEPIYEEEEAPAEEAQAAEEWKEEQQRKKEEMRKEDYGEEDESDYDPRFGTGDHTVAEQEKRARTRKLWMLNKLSIS